MLARRRNRIAQDSAAHAAAASDSGAPSSISALTSTIPFVGSIGADKKEANTMLESLMEAFSPNVLPALFGENSSEEALGSGTGDAALTETGPFSHLPIRLARAILLMYLHTCNGPPDFPRITPCAMLECWIDPLVAQGSHQITGGGSEGIAEALERQYRSVLRDVIPISRVVEANLEVASMMLGKARGLARDGRVLVHYNGHGMPRATDLGEVWVFDCDHTHYIPFNITDMADLIGTPTLYIFDCNFAGAVLRHWKNNRLHEKRPHDLFICACNADETLPLNPLLPADMLTACLTTPLKMALWWYIGYSHYKMLLPQVTEEMIRNLPGDLNDRKSPRGDLNWVLNAVTTTIAWCTLSPSQFHYLFRHDSGTKAIFRNAILADRLMRETGVTPITHPPLAEETHLHPMWELWDYVLERAISQLPGLMASSPDPDAAGQVFYKESSFFDDQLTAFEVWVHSGDVTQIPQQLPCVLFALTQGIHRVRAFTLLAKYLDSGLRAGRRATLCGILPYLSKLLTQAPEVLLIVTVVWMQVIRSDPLEGCEEVHRSKSEKYFTNILMLDEVTTTIETVGYGERVDYATEAAKLSSPLPEAGVDASGQPLPSRSRSSHRDTGRRAGSARRVAEAGKYVYTGTSPTTGPFQPPRAASRPSNRVNHTNSRGVTYYLMNDVDLPRSKSMVCYILYQYQLQGEAQCLSCWNHQLLNAAFPCLSSNDAELRSWACLVLSMLFRGLRHAKNFASRECASRLDLFTRLLRDRSPIVRSSCVTLLTSVIGVRIDLLPLNQQVRRLQMEKSVLIKLRQILFDASMSVREELIYFACQVIYVYRSVLPKVSVSGTDGFSIQKIQEYVQAVGRESPQWVLEEPGVQVHSLLNLNRPTLNTIFDDNIVFHISVLAADDPDPTPKELDPSRLASEAIKILLGLLHDAALMLWMVHHDCDASKVDQAVGSLSAGQAPQSSRFASEALRTMSHLPTLSSSYFFSEADRARARWNEDMMRLLVLDNSGRKLEPHRRSAGAASLAQGTASSTTTLAGPSPTIQMLLSAGTRYQVFPGLVRPDRLVCVTPRALEMTYVVATKDQQVMYISYEGYNTQTLLKSFPVRLVGPIHDLLVINDLSEHSGLLLVNKRGGFTLMKGIWDADAVPVEAAVFSACLPRPAGHWIDLKTVYHNQTATLFYGGPIGASGETELHALCVSEEQVTQRLEVPGNPGLSCLAVHSTQRALLAGFVDGVVRYYDDRQRQGGVTMVASLQVGWEPTEAVLTVGPIATTPSSTFTIAATTRDALCVFDTRKLNRSVLRLTVPELLSPGVEKDRPAASIRGGTLPFITSGAFGLHTGLVGLAFSDYTYAAFNPKGQILTEGRVRPSSYDAVVASSTATGGAPLSLLPRSFVAHPLSPLLSFGGDLMFFQL